MKNIFEKTKILNYVASLVFVIVAIMFMRKLSITGWRIDIFNGRQLARFFKFITSGKIFGSLKYVSFLLTMVGMVIVMVSGVNIAMNIKYPLDAKEDGVNENAEGNSDDMGDTSKEKEETASPVVIERTQEIAPAPVKVFDIPAPEKRFEMYNNPQQNVENNGQMSERPNEETVNVANMPQTTQIIEDEGVNENNNVEQKPEENSISEDEERAKLQSKIREVMERMKEKQNEENKQEEAVKANVAPVIEPEVAEKEEKVMAPQKILEPMQFDGKGRNPLLQNMNFKKISPEDNNMMERNLIGAGFKLLSEIRIGTTGIDYLAVGKNKLVVVQLDTTDGNWSASEDVVEGSNTPVWFGENGTKVSPVARAIEARDNIVNLIQDQIQIPVEAVACLGNSRVVNVDDMRDEWKKLGVDIARLRNADEIADGIEQIDAMFPNSSQIAPDEAEMTQLISILEKAEIPE